MSVSDEEISGVEDGGGVGVSGGDVHDDDDEDDDEKISGVHRKHHDHDQIRRGYLKFSGFSMNLGKAKSFVLGPFNRGKLPRKSKSHTKASSSRVASSSGKRINGVNNKGCFFCFTPPNPSGESAIEAQSQTSDPNHPSFTHDMLRVLMENSDFYSKECNTHLDSDSSFGNE